MEEHINAIENLKERQKVLDAEIAKHEEVLKSQIGDNEKAKMLLTEMGFPFKKTN